MGKVLREGQFRDGSKEKELFETKGKMWYVLSMDDDVVNYTIKHTSELETDIFIFDLMTGKEFIEATENGSLTEYDGHISHVFVDDYITNLGVFTEEFIGGGGFLLEKDVFLDLCNNKEVYVNWVNK